MTGSIISGEDAVALEMGFCRAAVVNGRKSGASATEKALAKAAQAFLEVCGQAFYGDEGEDAANRDAKQASETIEVEARAIMSECGGQQRMAPASVWLWGTLAHMTKGGWPDVTKSLRDRIRDIVADDEIRLAVCAA